MYNLKVFNTKTAEVLALPFKSWDEVDTILSIIGFLNADYEIWEDGELVEKWFNGEPMVY